MCILYWFTGKKFKLKIKKNDGKSTKLVCLTNIQIFSPKNPVFLANLEIVSFHCMFFGYLVYYHLLPQNVINKQKRQCSKHPVTVVYIWLVYDNHKNNDVVNDASCFFLSILMTWALATRIWNQFQFNSLSDND